MTRVLHTAWISNVEIIKCVVNNKDARVIVEKDHLHYLSPSLKFTIFIIYYTLDDFDIHRRRFLPVGRQ